jgi:hypothetical protein
MRLHAGAGAGAGAGVYRCVNVLVHLRHWWHKRSSNLAPWFAAVAREEGLVGQLVCGHLWSCVSCPADAVLLAERSVHCGGLLQWWQLASDLQGALVA